MALIVRASSDAPATGRTKRSTFHKVLPRHSTTAAPSPTPPATVRPLRLDQCIVGAVTGRGGPLWLGRRLRFYLRDGELLQPARCGEEFVAVDVCVARHGREVGVTKVFGDEAGVAQLLPEPGRRGVAQRVRGDVLLDRGALRGSPDDVGEDR